MHWPYNKLFYNDFVQPNITFYLNAVSVPFPLPETLTVLYDAICSHYSWQVSAGQILQEILSLGLCLSLTCYSHKPSYCQDPEMCSGSLRDALVSQGCKTG